ncbi:MAG: Ribosomal RNA small subunit methyltransferase D [Flavobacterium sp. SCGC AAA160-P02]|nr:MAG: Ribosomal RNA small subunit methyltransferase D [Flavobacterium sp. SCGC AAA160-P02]
MRIVSGKQKGRKIRAPKKLPVRPTTDLAKESLFNILNNHYYFNDISVIDLFSGTGNISFEFASRGSKNIHAVDNNYNCIKFINKTSDEFDFTIKSYKMDVFKFLEKTPLRADIIFADPPYNMDIEKYLTIVNLVFERKLLHKNGLLILEHSKHMVLSENIFFRYSKKYGGNVFSFFEVEEL